MYLLDTNICIFIKNKKPKQVLDHLHQVINQNLYISSITVAELYFGVFNSQNIEKNHISLVEFLAPFKILDFDDEDAKEFGRIRSKLKKEGKLIGPYDMQIAAQAIAKKLILVTNNTNEFIRVDGIKIEDWN
ncbi:type II toxin-antitoxin system tRNA(fMet)-specific endonuclease VapC [Gracilinema caldarium]|uniref:PilT protein domain protein n=1 Tax=Gracilinema caldarium (strain ATCC 51460 / DSM 7334 / H1) TaxID=744872 RepID=F8EYB8_GRAC1|nr:type II toxin-antitoxin system VapC family toxin [Gracilinema caldarium]AEJ18277.1 PilT protein domain protein [Gracilinema caldarium DSM 7334]